MQCTLTAFAELAYHDRHMAAEAGEAALRWKTREGSYSGERESILLPSFLELRPSFRSSSLLAVRMLTSCIYLLANRPRKGSRPWYTVQRTLKETDRRTRHG